MPFDGRHASLARPTGLPIGRRYFRTKRRLTIQQLLVWVYKDQRVIEISGRGMFEGESARKEPWGHQEQFISRDGCAAIERNAILGANVDGSGPIRGIPQPLHPDAETVHEVVLRLPWEQAGLLISFAKRDTEPEIPT